MPTTFGIPLAALEGAGVLALLGLLLSLGVWCLERVILHPHRLSVVDYSLLRHSQQGDLRTPKPDAVVYTLADEPIKASGCRTSGFVAAQTATVRHNVLAKSPDHDPRFQASDRERCRLQMQQ